jgi:hypothetical protein
MKIYTDKQVDIILGELLELEKLVNQDSYVVAEHVRLKTTERIKQIREVLLQAEVVNIQVQTP